jgi:hypothetical protein
VIARKSGKHFSDRPRLIWSPFPSCLGSRDQLDVDFLALVARASGASVVPVSCPLYRRRVFFYRTEEHAFEGFCAVPSLTYQRRSTSTN